MKSAIAAFCFLSACSHGAREETTPPQQTAVVPQAVVSEPERGADVIVRGDLVPVLDAGLGAFLRGVEVEAVVRGGTFVGFRLKSFYPSDPRFAELPVKVGDIIKSVNSSSIERPEQAFAVFEELRVSSALVIAYERDGVDAEVRYRIED